MARTKLDSSSDENTIMKPVRALIAALIVASAAACAESPTAPRATDSAPTQEANFGSNSYGSGLSVSPTAPIQAGKAGSNSYGSGL